VKFDHPTYIVNENSGSVQVVLVLRDKSPSDITIQVDSIDISANGKLCILPLKGNITLTCNLF